MDIENALAENRAAVDELITAADGARDHWTTPRAPGKWSPSQVVEHVILSLEEASNVVAERPNKFPTFPSFVRPLMRTLFFKRILKSRKFPKVKTAPGLDPEKGPNTTGEGEQRLRAALAMFEEASRARLSGGRQVLSGAFGAVSVEDYATFQEIHTRHHCGQIPTA